MRRYVLAAALLACTSCDACSPAPPCGTYDGDVCRDDGASGGADGALDFGPPRACTTDAECDDGNACTTTDACGASHVCTYVAAADGTTCASGVCESGACVACGGVGGPCCVGSTCGADTLTCATVMGRPRCTPCGGSHEPCCFVPMVDECAAGFCDLATSTCP